MKNKYTTDDLYLLLEGMEYLTHTQKEIFYQKYFDPRHLTEIAIAEHLKITRQGVYDHKKRGALKLVDIANRKLEQ